MAKFLVLLCLLLMACGEVDGSLEGVSSGSGPTRQSSSGNNTATSSSSAFDLVGVIWKVPPPESYVYGTTERIELSPFEISKDLITHGQYKEVMGTYPSGGTKNDNSPVDGVTWFKAVEFCRKYSELTGWDIRLPTEAQWYYTVCSSDEYSGCPASPTITRNTAYWEWTKDCFDSKFPYQLKDPSGPPNCLTNDPKVRKGFNRAFNDSRLTFSFSYPDESIVGYDPISFRVVRMGNEF
jgi:formylglycine-generating enzyme required for sulfatase activity